LAELRCEVTGKVGESEVKVCELELSHALVYGLVFRLTTNATSERDLQTAHHSSSSRNTSCFPSIRSQTLQTPHTYHLVLTAQLLNSGTYRHCCLTESVDFLQPPNLLAKCLSPLRTSSPSSTSRCHSRLSSNPQTTLPTRVQPRRSASARPTATRSKIATLRASAAVHFSKLRHLTPWFSLQRKA
jgi:hypothetical protein